VSGNKGFCCRVSRAIETRIELLFAPKDSVPDHSYA